LLKARLGRGGIVTLVVVAAVVVGVLTAGALFSRGDVICRGVHVAGIDVGGMQQAQAEKLVRDWARTRVSGRITLTALDERWVGAMSDFGMVARWKEAVQKAHAIGRSSGLFGNATDLIRTVISGRKIDVQVAVDESKIRPALHKVAMAVNRPHTDATFAIVGSQPVIHPEKYGIKLDKELAIRIIKGALQDGYNEVPLPVDQDDPDVFAKDLRSIDTRLSSFTTRFNAGQRDRTHNLRLAAGRINDVVLKPGQEFSYNSRVGERLANRGFRDAPIFVNGKLEPGLGGGVCQVSTTLYNAVLLADVTVVERHHHSRTIPYASPGRDATVAYGSRDFRIRNTFSTPIYITAHASSNHLSISIYGSGSDKKTVTVWSSAGAWTEHGEKTIIDKTLKPGARKVVDKGARGVSATVYRRITGSDGESTVQVVSRDKYPPQAKIIAVGPPVTPQPDLVQAEPASAVDTGYSTRVD
jgi:vancomycin resistance protein YoaR